MSQHNNPALIPCHNQEEPLVTAPTNFARLMAEAKKQGPKHAAALHQMYLRQAHTADEDRKAARAERIFKDRDPDADRIKHASGRPGSDEY